MSPMSNRDDHENTWRQARRAAERRGRTSEFMAMAFLLMHGYWPLARRVRTAVGEIDLIVRRGATIVFVEVKQRASSVDAIAAVTRRQQHRLYGAAESWLARHPAFAQYTIRFDVVAMGRFWPRHLIDVIRY